MNGENLAKIYIIEIKAVRSFLCQGRKKTRGRKMKDS